ncbi:nitroreductase [Kitasatospora sp. NPDC093806]|uniref:nitroreductase family protein n=1 Tax=Kitasatospora sp. NPDC093806 TaxID=3155075 RepID=UPI0034387C9A
MDVMNAVLTRRSVNRLGGPPPSEELILELLRAASTVPDHGRLKPWRLTVLQGEERKALGEALAAVAPPEQAARAREKPFRAPMLISIVFCPDRHHPKVPEWEQLASAATLVNTLHLLLHSRGWGAIWRTGAVIDAPEVRACAGVGATERLLGWLYVGRPDPEAALPPRPPFDPGTKIRFLGSADPSETS